MKSITLSVNATDARRIIFALLNTADNLEHGAVTTCNGNSIDFLKAVIRLRPQVEAATRKVRPKRNPKNRRLVKRPSQP